MTVFEPSCDNTSRKGAKIRVAQIGECRTAVSPCTAEVPADVTARPTEDGWRRRPVFNGHVSRYRGCREQGSECDTGNQKLFFHNAPACRSILADSYVMLLQEGAFGCDVCATVEANSVKRRSGQLKH